MTSNQRLTVTLSVLASIVVAFIVGFAIGQPAEIPLSERVLTECESKDVSEESGTTEDVAAILRSNGYYGIPGDGGEILYSDACRAQYDAKIPVASR